VMKPSLRRNSIAARLTWMNILVSGIALLLAYVSFLAYDLYVYRQAAIESLSGLAKIVGTNSVSAIIFNDDASAQATLSGLSSSNDVTAAAIYTNSGNRFAQYVREKSSPIQPRMLPDNSMQANWVEGLDIETATRIEFQGKSVGTVYIHARLHGLRKQAVQYATMAGIILLLCLGVALLVGVIFRKLLAEPIVSLAETARLVSRSRDYSLRFTPPQDYDELLSLTDAFNEMLSEIQQRDSALEQAKVTLELRVEDRTKQLQTANRELEAFSYTVAHDLRSSLQAISNICFLFEVMEQQEPSAERTATLVQLRSSVTAMSNMIEDLLDLSRSTSAELQLTEMDLSPLASSILKGLADAHPDRQVRTVVHPDCHVRADAGLIQIVLQNLLRNAWKFTGQREIGEIEFGCSKRGNATVVHVRDNGAGFDERLAERLFQPFQRLHAAAEFPGTGIGLATVRRIVSRHGGEVWAKGEVDKGATFYFTLEDSE
jgi:signal transduction histidine kinase